MKMAQISTYIYINNYSTIYLRVSDRSQEWTDFELDLAADNPEQEHYTGKNITSNYLRAWRNQQVLMTD